jgi:hypothetical protein
MPSPRVGLRLPGARRADDRVHRVGGRSWVTAAAPLRTVAAAAPTPARPAQSAPTRSTAFRTGNHSAAMTHSSTFAMTARGVAFVRDSDQRPSINPMIAVRQSRMRIAPRRRPRDGQAAYRVRTRNRPIGSAADLGEIVGGGYRWQSDAGGAMPWSSGRWVGSDATRPRWLHRNRLAS